MILLFHNFLHFAKLLNKKYGTHTESRILHLHKIFYSAESKGVYIFLAIVFPGCHEASGRYAMRVTPYPHAALMVTLIAVCPMDKGMQHIMRA